MVAASILQARGYRNLVDINQGWVEMEKNDIPISEYVCPTNMTQEEIDKAVSEVI